MRCPSKAAKLGTQPSKAFTRIYRKIWTKQNDSSEINNPNRKPTNLSEINEMRWNKLKFDVYDVSVIYAVDKLGDTFNLNSERNINPCVCFSPTCRGCDGAAICDITIWEANAGSQWLSLDDESETNCDKWRTEDILEMHGWRRFSAALQSHRNHLSYWRHWTGRFQGTPLSPDTKGHRQYLGR